MNPSTVWKMVEIVTKVERGQKGRRLTEREEETELANALFDALRSDEEFRTDVMQMASALVPPDQVKDLQSGLEIVLAGKAAERWAEAERNEEVEIAEATADYLQSAEERRRADPSYQPFFWELAKSAGISRENAESRIRGEGLDPDAFAEAVELWAEGFREMQMELQASVKSRYPEFVFPYYTSYQVSLRHSFLIAEDVVFRFPRDKDSDAHIEGELSILPVLTNRLPIQIPQVKYDGHEADDWTKRFVGFSMLPGPYKLKPAYHSRTIDSVRMARTLGRVVAGIHTTQMKDALEAGIECTTAADTHKEVDRAYRFLRAAPKMQHEFYQRLIETFFLIALKDDEVWEFRPTLVHGRLMDHTRFDKSQNVVALGGWSSAYIGDPAVDLGDILITIGPHVIGDTLEAYQTSESPEHIWRRTLTYWGIKLLETAVAEMELGQDSYYVWTDLVKDQVLRMFSRTPKIGKRSLLSRVGRLVPGG